MLKTIYLVDLYTGLFTKSGLKTSGCDMLEKYESICGDHLKSAGNALPTVPADFMRSTRKHN